MSLCNICPKPGNCCSGFYLHYKHGGEYTETSLEMANSRMKREGKPFVAIGHFSDDYKRAVKFMCPVLLPNGRCGEYENRPDICKVFEAGSGDPLCVFGKIRQNQNKEFLGEGVA